MARVDLKGMGVALVTPFKADKSIDFTALSRLIEYQIKSGIDFLVVLGTTAETPTLSADEKRQVREFVTGRVAGRVPLVLGVGGNNTMAVVEELQTLDLSGYQAVLSVVPYYNKPSQEGIYIHYAAIAKASPVPVVLYNVPGRTFPLITLGAVGVISVIGNAFPKEFSRMVRLALEGDYANALLIHHRFTELFSLLFVDGNPAGVKCLLHAMGFMENELRLPLVPTRITTYEKIHRVLDTLVK